MIAKEAAKRAPVFTRPSSGADHMLRRFRTANKRLMPTIRRLELDWPNVEEIQRRIAEYVTDGVMGPVGKGSRSTPQPILHLALMAALEAYDAAASEPDDCRLAAFVDQAVREVTRHLDGISLSASDNRTWTPQSGAPLLEWLARVPPTMEIRINVDQQRATAASNITLALERYALSDADRCILEEARDGR